MNTSWIVVAAVACAAGSFAVPAPAPQGAAPQRVAVTYAEWLVPYVGKDFYLSVDHTIATQKGRTSAVPAGPGEFSLAGVGADFAYFEDRSKRICVPLAKLSVVFDK